MQTSAPLVSALVTTFNHEAFVVDAIESLLAQTYPAVEIIVVDDGSQDRTFDLACEYRSRGVRVLRGPEKGPSHAMNMAMAAASGEYFLLQSGDDMSPPFRADVQVRALADVDLHAGLPSLIDGGGRTLPDAEFPVFFRSYTNDARGLFKILYEEGNFLCASSFALRRAVWEKLGGFHPGLLQLQDYEYWLRAIAEGFSLFLDQERLAFYRIHDRNLSSSLYDVRMNRELTAVLRLLQPRIPIAYIKETLYGTSFDGVQWCDLDREILLALLFLRHPMESVRQIGIEKLIASLGDDGLAASLEREFGLSFRAIFDLLLRQ